MNYGIIICTHGKTGIEIMNSVKMITGLSENIEAIEFLEHNSPEEITNKYNEAIKKINKDNIIFLVDIQGGTPFNCAARLKLENKNYEVITGVNIPIVISLFLEGESKTFKEAIDLALNTGKESINLLRF